ncbi:MAG: EF-P lysine aminoacylase GenX [Deltaproteobacteria bacterium]|jgi:lysyl-tRNA synthetase class 2|nr:EF-P lysine aminoacylase GenX [Deltaproteobacteria bacterium]
MKPYRQQTLKKNFLLRARIIRAVRRFFHESDYLEVETPIRIPAPAPEAHIDAVASGDWFLQTSPELCMKRLLAAGFPRIFQICKCFRQAERGHRHLPEITLLEWYRTGSTYQDLMDECEALIMSVARRMGSSDILAYQGRRIKLAPPWPRIPVKDAFEKFASSPLAAAVQKDRFDEIMAVQIEPRLGRSQPVFLVDYPASRAALAKLKPEHPRYAERFELYIAGVEICNAFSELADPVEQRARFEHERALRRKTGKPVYPMPERFLAALQDLPAAAGNAMGIDRLVMLFADAKQIDDVVAFTPEEL